MYYVFKFLLRLLILYISIMYFRVYDKWLYFLKIIYMYSFILNFLVYIFYFCIFGVIMVLVKDYILYFVT